MTPAFRSDVRDIAVSVRGLSNRPGVSAQVQARLRADPGGTLTEHGTLRLTPLAADVTVALDGVEPGRFAAYLRDRVAFDVVSGTVRLGAHVRFQQEKAAPRIAVSDGSVQRGRSGAAPPQRQATTSSGWRTSASTEQPWTWPRTP